ncbi:DUF2948 family protein [Methylobrevis pamukkalensis]|uniref:DUF2948 domain-containing protein n=1 Tax=Methylobrevis pamukkalensis TaxID=1439726 RepID=A0A1E3GZT8_9HYPH|nr:DUF2948 family protein [Methylobrevis pamukkalensis]ODN69573.1 hypothetical protein A6302_03118 [Methylobrevis pamukkalensis]
MSDLKLAALDAEDLSILSAHVQDGVLKVADIDWRPREKRLLVTLNRFVWEKVGETRSDFERRRAVLHFARVEAVKAAHVRREAPDAVLALLALRFEETDAPAGRIFLEFAGGGSLRLDVECIEASLADVGAAWSTANCPKHEA